MSIIGIIVDTYDDHERYMKYKTEKKRKCLCYWLGVFPSLSETFILNELIQLRKIGLEIKILSMRKTDDEIYHPEARSFLNDTLYFNIHENKNVIKTLILHIRYLLLYPINYLRTVLFSYNKRDEALLHYFKNVVYYARVIENFGIYHLHVHYASKNAQYAMLVSKLLRIPFTIGTHGHDVYISPPRNYSTLAEISNGIIVNCKYAKKYLHSNFKVPMNKIHVVYTGIDTTFFNNKFYNNNGNIILSVGRLSPIKSFEYLIQACRILQDKNIKFKCIIVGEGPERQKLEEQIAELYLREVVVLAGAKVHEDLLKYYQQAKIFALSSVSESLANVIKEAMACHLPVVATNVRGVPEVVEDSETGFLVPPKDSEKLADCMEVLLKDEDLCRQIGNNGRRKVEKEHTFEVQAQKLFELFNHPKTDSGTQ